MIGLVCRNAGTRACTTSLVYQHFLNLLWQWKINFISGCPAPIYLLGVIMKFRPFSPKRDFTTKHTHCLQAALQGISQAGKGVPVARAPAWHHPKLCQDAWGDTGEVTEALCALCSLSGGQQHRGGPTEPCGTTGELGLFGSSWLCPFLGTQLLLLLLLFSKHTIISVWSKNNQILWF